MMCCVHTGHAELCVIFCLHRMRAADGCSTDSAGLGGGREHRGGSGLGQYVQQVGYDLACCGNCPAQSVLREIALGDATMNAVLTHGVSFAQH